MEKKEYKELIKSAKKTIGTVNGFYKEIVEIVLGTRAKLIDTLTTSIHILDKDVLKDIFSLANRKRMRSLSIAERQRDNILKQLVYLISALKHINVSKLSKNDEKNIQILRYIINNFSSVDFENNSNIILKYSETIEEFKRAMYAHFSGIDDLILDGNKVLDYNLSNLIDMFKDGHKIFEK